MRKHIMARLPTPFLAERLVELINSLSDCWHAYQTHENGMQLVMIQGVDKGGELNTLKGVAVGFLAGVEISIKATEAAFGAKT